MLVVLLGVWNGFILLGVGILSLMVSIVVVIWFVNVNNIVKIV